METLYKVAPAISREVGLANLEKLRNEWTTLEGSAIYPPQQFAWQKAAAQIFAKPSDIVTYTSWEKGDLTAAISFAQRGLARTLVIPGADLYYEPGEGVYRSPEDFASIAQELAQSSTPLIIARTLQDGALATTLIDAHKSQGSRIIYPQDPRKMVEMATKALAENDVVIVRPASSSTYIDFSQPGPWEAMLVPNESEKRKLKKLEKAHGKIDFTVHTPHTPDKINELFDRVYDVQSRSWKASAGLIGRDNEVGRLFRQYCLELGNTAEIKIPILSVQGKDIAAEFDVDFNGRRIMFKTYYDQNYAAFSPGSLNSRKAIEDAKNSGLSRYDLMGIPEDWKTKWTPEADDSISVLVLPRGIRGTIAFAEYLSSAYQRKLRERSVI